MKENRLSSLPLSKYDFFQKKIQMFQINDNLDLPEPQKIIPLLLVTFVTKSTAVLMMMIMLFMVMSIITMVVTLLLILVVFSQLLS